MACVAIYIIIILQYYAPLRADYTCTCKTPKRIKEHMIACQQYKRNEIIKIYIYSELPNGLNKIKPPTYCIEF